MTAYYRFGWDIFVTAALLDDLEVCFPGAPSGGRQSASQILPAIFRRTGGLPISTRRLSLDERTRAARTMLLEAGAHAARSSLDHAELDGYALNASSLSELGQEIAVVKRVAINRATRDELIPLPAIGPARADAIIADRRERGLFLDARDLMERIDGIGPANIGDIALCLDFRPPGPAVALVRLNGDFRTDFPALVTLLSGGADWSALLQALELIATSCASEPHPAVSHGRMRDFRAGAAEDLAAVDWLGVLWSNEFIHAVTRFIEASSQRVDVCVFHMTVPGPADRTRKLLDSLVDAHERGVVVRVLLDRDQATDPYLSTIINSPARAWLSARGIACRFDTADRLLHSKFLVIDDDLAVVGSHNWTKTSLVRMEDLSLAVHSTALAGELRTRFAQLWQTAE